MQVMQAVEIRADVLGYAEDGEHVALALQMDLRGYGATFDEALADLEDLIRMQISFAVERNQPELIWRDAEPRWFDLYSRARSAMLHSLFAEPRQSGEADFIAADLPIPPAHVIKAMNTHFAPNG